MTRSGGFDLTGPRAAHMHSSEMVLGFLVWSRGATRFRMRSRSAGAGLHGLVFFRI
jgi:hypothetical protein